MTVKLLCAKCGACLVPAMTGLRCPRMSACGRGGYLESLPLAAASVEDAQSGVQA